MKVSTIMFVAVTLVVLQVTLGKRDKPEREERGACRYNRAQWGECNASGQKTRSLTLKNGPDTCENPKTETKACRSSDEGRSGSRKQGRQDRRGGRQDRRGGRRGDDCQYDRADWSACDEDTDMMTMTLTLQADQPDTCNATKTITKRCRGQGGKSRGCKYEVTRTSECVDGKATLTKTLVPGSATTCEATKTAEKRCASAARAAKRQEKKDARQARKEARQAGRS